MALVPLHIAHRNPFPDLPCLYPARSAVSHQTRYPGYRLLVSRMLHVSIADTARRSTHVLNSNLHSSSCRRTQRSRCTHPRRGNIYEHDRHDGRILRLVLFPAELQLRRPRVRAGMLYVLRPHRRPTPSSWIRTLISTCRSWPHGGLIGCGDSLENGGTNVTASDCSSPCTGDATELCGAGSEFFPKHLEVRLLC